MAIRTQMSWHLRTKLQSEATLRRHSALRGGISLLLVAQLLLSTGCNKSQEAPMPLGVQRGNTDSANATIVADQATNQHAETHERCRGQANSPEDCARIMQGFTSQSPAEIEAQRVETPVQSDHCDSAKGVLDGMNSVELRKACGAP
jgi:hypothetical protein